MLWNQLYRAIVSGTPDCDDLRQFVNVLVSIVFQVTAKKILMERILASANAALVSLFVERYSFVSAKQSFLNLPAESISSSTQVFRSQFFKIMFENALTVSLKTFNFHSFGIYASVKLDKLKKTLHH